MSSASPLVEVGLQGRRPGARGSAARWRAACADALVDLEAEQLAKRGLAVGRLVVEEVGEPALGQHDGAVELVDVQAEQLLDRRVIAAGVGGQHLVAAFEPGLLGGRAVRGAPHDAHGGVALAAELEVEPHPGLRCSSG